MPEIRLNPTTKEWVIIATERAKRPKDFAKDKPQAAPLPERDENCPFCPGNEEKTPGEVFAIREPGAEHDPNRWQVRVIPNKFPALTCGGTSDHVERIHTNGYLHMPGLGKHEVVIESQWHDRTLATLDDEQVERVTLAYRRRYMELDSASCNELILIFRNQGERAGTSLLHPHSQIIALPVVPVHIRNRLNTAQRYYDEMGSCVYCDMIASESRSRARVVMENGEFVALTPYAATVPYETWILPRRHQASFGAIGNDECQAFAHALKDVLGRMYRLLDNPDYNFSIQTAPHYSASEPHYHWHVEVLPRLTTPAGFEIGTHMYINVVLPEQAAEDLRGA
jgi:UDPglucose--hexose-1-phosphate uridylyltransferase